MLLNRIGKIVGYVKAPKATYMARHPVKGTKALVTAKGAKGLITTRAGAVLGGLVALPVGLLMFMKRRGKNSRD
jgi:hypothetical protein